MEIKMDENILCYGRKYLIHGKVIHSTLKTTQNTMEY